MTLPPSKIASFMAQQQVHVQFAKVGMYSAPTLVLELVISAFYVKLLDVNLVPHKILVVLAILAIP